MIRSKSIMLKWFPIADSFVEFVYVIPYVYGKHLVIYLAVMKNVQVVVMATN